MNRYLGFSLGLLLLAGCSGDASEQGFAGLAGLEQSAAGETPYLQPGPGDRLAFPADFGPHPQHRIEWWYLTANLETTDGEPLGVQWTQFRQALQPRVASKPAPDSTAWPLQAAWMAHGAVSWKGKHYFTEKLARGDMGNAGATAVPFQVWLDNWRLQGNANNDRWQLQAAGEGWSYDLMLAIHGEPVGHGNKGFSAKSAGGEGSMYFSLVDIAITGEVVLEGKALEVSGKGWFDREWSSQLLKTGQKGWDWFALHLDSGDKLMAFQLRDDSGSFRSGTWLPAEGDPIPLSSEEVGVKALERRKGVPVRWQLSVPAYQVNLELSAPPGDYLNAGLYPYWESPVEVSGSHSGVGYMELTGYAD
ncbi:MULTISPECIES: lipocalin-like domain-containing protein [Marinobacter]|uniref:Lipocalin-like domain-containing protein n=1 Tax=Marinobacter xiaoshiensis TaxID=3073652 RepID=A0ABU2HDD4_9GAMM|nr:MULTISPECIES: lipocalin-like domain-containing protein [unclassified Marinobacter]MBK1887187.1 carotenoid 1,2-hydratase [Marinobacter sp. DY40_1A1]MDS1308758.1 lipocalin-like domain-containing protein [Marinobacter sp. F60267]